MSLYLWLALALLWQASAHASVPEVKGSQIRDFYRLTFEWPRPTYLTASVDGNILTINFERKADPDMGTALGALKSVIESHSLSQDQRTLTLKLKGSYRARAFVSGSVSGVDVIPSRQQSPPARVISATDGLENLKPAAGEEASQVAEAKPQAEEKAAPAAKVVSPAAKPADSASNASANIKRTDAKAQVAPPAEDSPKQETLAVVVPEPEPEIVTKPEPKPEAETKAEPTETPDAQAETTPEEEPTPQTQQAEQQVSEVIQAPTTDQPEVSASEESGDTAQDSAQAQNTAPEETATPPTDVQATQQPQPEETEETQAATDTTQDAMSQAQDELEQAAEEAESESENAAKTLKVHARLEGEDLKLMFPWQQRTAVAAYVRNNLAWVVFNNVANLDLRQVNTMLRAGVTIKQLPTNEATVFYVPVATGAGVEVRAIEGTFRWEIVISANQQYASEPVKPLLSTEPPLKPHVLMQFLDVAKVVRIKDPVIGDALDVLPVFEEGKGVTPARSFPEFELLDTVQGLVVLRRSNDTTVNVVRNGVQISTHQGATITPDLPLPEEVEKDLVVSESGVLFPFEDWRVNVGGSHQYEIDLIKRKIARSLVSEEVEYYRRIAELHLAYGEAVEALGYLQNIKRLDSEYFIRHRLSALQGAANFLLHRYQDAARNFRVSELKDVEEVEFWQVMLGELLGKPTTQFDYEANYEPYIQHYPPILKQRIGIFAADRYIANREYNAALQVFDQLNEHKLINEVADYINYLMGKIALETQTPEDGYELWSKIVTGKATEFVKVRAEFALIIELLKRGGIKKDVALSKLERLAIRWRGDNLELAVLSTLSDIYEKDKNWPEAIRVWRSINEAFPNTVEAVDATRKMDDAFVAIFDRGEKGDTSDIELLFLYNRYRELIPDNEVGDRIVEKIADLMVDLDMLGAAAELLEGRMRFRFEHVERSKVGAKLARVLLLDKKPEAALKALQLSVYGLLPDDLLVERNHLSAQALLELKRYDDLFLLLKNDTSAKADYFRLQAHWQAKDWKKLAENGEMVLKSRTSATAPLSALERDTLVKLALAYVALEEREQTAYLRDYFTPLMKDKPQYAVFNYLTQPYLDLTPDNFEQVSLLLDRTQTFLANDYGANQPAATTDAEDTPQGS